MVDDNFRTNICIGCKKEVKAYYDKWIWDEELKKWQYTDLGYLCPICYPIYKNLISVFKKAIREDFVDAKKDLIFRFNENIKKYW